MNKKTNESVSVGIPVRNGSPFIEGAINDILSQTYENIEIIISDNNSSDNTVEICKKYAQLDNRITLYQQTKTITALENFKFVFEKSKSNFFIWAAHDDRRSSNYIECLLREMKVNENASLVFSDISKFFSEKSISIPDYKFEIEKNDHPKLHIDRTFNSKCYEIYGLIRSEHLRKYNWADIEYGPDRILLIFLSMQGDFIKANGTTFYYYEPQVPKSDDERSKENFLKKKRKFSKLILAIKCANQAKTAIKKHRTLHFLYFTIIISSRLISPTIKGFLFRYSPKFAKKFWWSIRG